jgi:hypothetical protein
MFSIAYKVILFDVPANVKQDIAPKILDVLVDVKLNSATIVAYLSVDAERDIAIISSSE